MSERISTWKLEEEGSSGRHLTGKRHSRRIQPRSLLSLLLSARRPFSPRPSRPPRKGCALFPSTRSASVSQEGPWRERYVGVEIKFLWRILTLRYRTLIARIACRWLLVGKNRTQMFGFEEEITRFAKATDCDIALITENDEK